jgi:hypothetical protein
MRLLDKPSVSGKTAVVTDRGQANWTSPVAGASIPVKARLAMALCVIAAAFSPAVGQGVARAQLSRTLSPYHVVYYDHSGTACATSTPTGKPAYSVTGLAFNGTDLLLSCWGDNTVTVINPHNGSQDTTAPGGFTVYQIFSSGGAPLKGIGAMAWDAADSELWACNLSAFTGTKKSKARDVGYITLDSSTGTGTFTHVFYTPKVASPTYGGCDNGVAFDPYAAVANPANPAPIWTASVSAIIYNWTAGGSMAASVPVGPLNIGPKAGGMAFSQNHMYIADPSTTTKHIYQLARGDFSGASTVSLLSGTHRFEDMACDPTTFAPKVVIWTEWFNQNAVKPIPVTDTSC